MGGHGIWDAGDAAGEDAGAAAGENAAGIHWIAGAGAGSAAGAVLDAADVAGAAGGGGAAPKSVRSKAAVPQIGANIIPAAVEPAPSPIVPIVSNESVWRQFVDEHNASLLGKRHFNVNPKSLKVSTFLENCKPAAIFVEDFANRYERGELGGEGQEAISDALRSINKWMMNNGHTTQLHFIVRDATAATSSGKIFLDGREISHTLHFTLGEQVLAQMCYPEPGSEYYTLHLDMWALSMTLTHAAGIPVVEFHSNNRANTFSTFSSPYHNWPSVLIGGCRDDCCVAQLLGLTQFDVIPRHPQHPQSHKKWTNWGFIDGIFRTTLHHIDEE